MTLVAVYVVVSTFLLGFSAAFWSSSGGLNVFVKALLIGAALFGAVCSAGLLKL